MSKEEKEKEKKLLDPVLVATFQKLRNDRHVEELSTDDVKPLPIGKREIREYFAEAKSALEQKLRRKALITAVETSPKNADLSYLKDIRKYLLIACDLYKFFFDDCPKELDTLCRELGAYNDIIESWKDEPNPNEAEIRQKAILAQLTDDKFFRFRFGTFRAHDFQKKMTKRYEKIVTLVQRGTVPEDDFHWVRRALRRMMHATQALAAKQADKTDSGSKYANYPAIFTQLYQLQKMLGDINKELVRAQKVAKGDKNPSVKFPDSFTQRFAKLQPMIEKVFDCVK